MEALWREAAQPRGEYSSHLWVTVLAMLYGTGLRRGELERLESGCLRSHGSDVADRWTQDRTRALRAGPEMVTAMPRGVSAGAAQPT